MRSLTRCYFVCLLIGLAGCENAGRDRLTSLDATAELVGLVFVDQNATREPDSQDRGAQGLELAMVVAGTADTVATATTGSDGTFRFTGLPVGRYELRLPAAALADSFIVVYREPPQEAVPDGLAAELPEQDPTTLAADDSAVVIIGIGHRRVPAAGARGATPGARLFAAGIALTRIDEFGESSLYVRGGGGAIRAIRVQPRDLMPGDSVHVFGTIATRAGQPVVGDARVHLVAAGASPEPIPVGVTSARTGGEGAELDAELVEVSSLVVADTGRTGGRFRVTTDDPEPLEIIIHQDGSFQPALLGPGAVLDVTGVLVPDSLSGSWRLWPRSGSDVIIVTPAPSP